MATDEKVLNLSDQLIGDRAETLYHQFLDLAEEVGSVTLDMQQVSLIDSMCLGILVLFNKKLIQKGGRLTIINPSRNVRELLTLTCLKQYFHVPDITGEIVSQLTKRFPIRFLNFLPFPVTQLII